MSTYWFCLGLKSLFFFLPFLCKFSYYLVYSCCHCCYYPFLVPASQCLTPAWQNYPPAALIGSSAFSDEKPLFYVMMPGESVNSVWTGSKVWTQATIILTFIVTFIKTVRGTHIFTKVAIPQFKNAPFRSFQRVVKSLFWSNCVHHWNINNYVCKAQYCVWFSLKLLQQKEKKKSSKL